MQRKMKTNKTKQIAANGINYLISAVLIISGTLKLVGFEPYLEVINRLSPHYYTYVSLIGLVALMAGILLAIPHTFSLGLMSTLVFLGGTISAHMQIGDSFILQIFFVVLTSTAAYLKRPEWFKLKKSMPARIE